MKTPKLSPIRLRMVLIGAIVFIYLIQMGIIVLGQSLLKQSSVDVTSAVAQSDTSKNTLDSLTAAEQTLQTAKASVEKSKKIAANAAGYEYQTQVINDLSSYAQKTGIKITSFTFSDPTAVTGATKGAAPAAVSTSAAAGATGTTGPKAIPGLTPVSVSVQLVTPVDYNAFLKLLRLIEGNLTHMQVQGVQVSAGGGSATPGTPASPDSVNISSINLEVYTKK